ncbi:MAG: ribonuclease D [Cellulomonadaceae bacterium]
MTATTVVKGDLPSGIADDLIASECVAVDTETSGLDWRSDQLLLCQLYSSEVGVILLRDVERRPQHLARVLESVDVLKVLHFAPFDIRFLSAQWGVSIRRLACSKAASKILDPALPAGAHSLASLVQRYLGVTLDKGSVRTSDWGAAALSPEQIAYASADVSHLPRLLDLLVGRLRESGREDLWLAVCEYMPADAQLEIDGVPNPLSY